MDIAKILPKYGVLWRMRADKLPRCDIVNTGGEAVITNQATRPEDEHPLPIIYNYELKAQ